MKNVYTVGQVNAYIKNMFTQDYMLRSIIVSGEASNVKYHSSGHLYFTIKDKTGSLSCIMFSSYVKNMSFMLREGSQIEVAGSVSIYERSGSYQLYATGIRHAGAGALYEKYEQLKKELSERGMFDEMYKQTIPRYARTVGIVTASTGAAVQDIMQIAARRNPYVQLILYPAQVQGDGARESIVAGIESLANYGVDVIIVGRGGGSIEDLWAFNEECVAEAIFNCPVPIVSAVGHETDTTIADYVADLRAPTPSAAAELTVFSIDDFHRDCHEAAYRMNSLMTGKITGLKSYVNQLSSRLDGLSPASKLRFKRVEYLGRLRELDSLMNDKINTAQNRMILYIEKLKLLSPLNRLESGFAMVTGEDGKKLTDVSRVNKGDNIKLTMKNGVIDASVVSTRLEEIGKQ